MKILELFAGYGSQRLALKYLGIDAESEISEIDRFAVQAYNQIHGETKNWGDICKIDETRLGEYDLVTYSSPCQDFSNAGLRNGGDEGTGTRSSLLWECRRIISATKPKYLLMENVKALTGKKFMPCFQKWLQTLENLGYDNYWRVLNAKDYGIPQNRERVFVVSIRKDIDQGFEFPKQMSLDKRLKDFLEQNVDEKFYLSATAVSSFLKSTFSQERNRLNTKDIAKTLLARDAHGPQLVSEPVIAASRGRNPDNPSDRTTGAPAEQRLEINSQGICNTLTNVQKDNYVLEPAVFTPKRTEYGKQIRKAYENGDVNESRHNMTIQEPRTDGISNTITTVQKDNYLCEPLKVKENTKKGYAEAYCGDSINLDQPSSKTRRGRVGHQVAQTLTCSCNQAVIEPRIEQVGVLKESTRSNGRTQDRVYSANGLAPTLNTCQGGNLEPKIIEPGIGHNPISKRFEFDGFSETKPCPTLLATDYKAPKCYSDGFRIRKLTPRECWRLMGVKDEDFDKLKDISKTQRYKLAGNSIVTNVMMAIFENLFINKTAKRTQEKQLTLF